MQTRYCRACCERVAAMHIPKHPLVCRTFPKGDEFVPVMDENDTEFDRVPQVFSPSITECVKAGEMPEKLGSAPEMTGLKEQRMARAFVDAFNAAGKRGHQPQAAPEPSPESSPESSPAAE